MSATRIVGVDSRGPGLEADDRIPISSGPVTALSLEFDCAEHRPQLLNLKGRRIECVQRRDSVYGNDESRRVEIKARAVDAAWERRHLPVARVGHSNYPCL